MEKNKIGTLYLVATPIGNLRDITLRALEVLKSVDLIAAEDTRHSKILLGAYEINKPLTSYHEHNKYEKAETLIAKLKEGLDIAVITDAGTPAISDPGEVLVKMCRDEGIKVTSLPGPSAVITALTISGMSTRRFCFEGFLPVDKKELAQALSRIGADTRTTVIYEAPHRLKKTLKSLAEVLGERQITFCRELTKVHEEAPMMSAAKALDYFNANEPRGEFVLVIEGRSQEEVKQEEMGKWEQMTMQEHLDYYLSQGLDKKEAMKQMAADRGVSKRDIYQALL